MNFDNFDNANFAQFGNWLVAIATPVFLASSSSGAYFLYGLLSLATVIVLWLILPETRGRSLEDIQASFQRPILRSWAHQVRRMFSRSSASESSDYSSDEQPIGMGVLTPPTPAATSSAGTSLRGGILSFESITV